MRLSWCYGAPSINSHEHADLMKPSLLFSVYVGYLYFRRIRIFRLSRYIVMTDDD